jgi:hypothetical protein
LAFNFYPRISVGVRSPRPLYSGGVAFGSNAWQTLLECTSVQADAENAEPEYSDYFFEHLENTTVFCVGKSDSFSTSAANTFKNTIGAQVIRKRATW